MLKIELQYIVANRYISQRQYHFHKKNSQYYFHRKIQQHSAPRGCQVIKFNRKFKGTNQHFIPLNKQPCKFPIQCFLFHAEKKI